MTLTKAVISQAAASVGLVPTGVIAPSALGLLGKRLESPGAAVDGAGAGSGSGMTTRVSVDYNRLESAFLIISALVLMAGMVFESRGFVPGSVGYHMLTALTAALIIVSSITFTALLGFEGYRSVKFSLLRQTARQAEVDTIEAAMMEERRQRTKLRRRSTASRLERPGA